MDKHSQEKSLSSFELFSQSMGIIVTCMGFLVLLGWVFNIPAMKSGLPGLVTMKVNTAICFVLSGIALWARQEIRNSGIYRSVAWFCSFGIIVIAVSSFFEYLYGINLGIDQIFWKDDPQALFTVYPGRMAVTTAISFIFISSGLFLSNSNTRRSYLLMQFLSLTVAVLSIFSLIAYLYGLKMFYISKSNFTPMALHTAGAFLLLGLGVFFLRPNKGMALAVTRNSLGSMVGKKLIPVAVIVPPCLGWIKLWLEAKGYLPNELGVTFVATMNMVAIIACIIWLVRSLNRIDQERLKIEGILRASQQQLQASNQQLQASQQQLKAYNQQLTANEQKLKAEIEERKKIEDSNVKYIFELESLYRARMDRDEQVIDLKAEVELLKDKIKKII